MIDLMAVIADELAIDVIREEDLLSQLPMDSLDYIDVLTKLEDASGKRLPDGKIPQFETVGELVEYFSA